MVWGERAQRIMLERDTVRRMRENPNYDPQTQDFEAEVDPSLTYSENRSNFRQKYAQEQSRYQRPVTNQRERSIRMLPEDYRQKWRNGKMISQNEPKKEEKYHALESEKERQYEGEYSGSSNVNREVNRGDRAIIVRQRVERVQQRFNPSRDSFGREFMPDFNARREPQRQEHNLVNSYERKERIPETSERTPAKTSHTEKPSFYGGLKEGYDNSRVIKSFGKKSFWLRPNPKTPKMLKKWKIW